MARGLTLHPPSVLRAALYAFTTFAIVCACIRPTLAQALLPPDHRGHARYHAEFYSRLHIPGTKISCCNNQDCRPIKHRITAKGVLFYVNGTWFQPPRERLIQMSTPDGGAHWCGIAFRGAPPHTYCAVIPPSAS